MVCLPSPDIPEAAGGAKFGSKLLDVNFTVNGIFAASSAPISTWLSTFVPYVAGTATANPAGHVSAVGVMAIPTFTFTAKASKGHRVTFSGRVTAGGVPAAGQPIAIYAKARNVARTNHAPGLCAKICRPNTSISILAAPRPYRRQPWCGCCRS